MTFDKHAERLAGEEYALARQLRAELAEARKGCEFAAIQYIECEDAFENLRVLIAKAEFGLDALSAEAKAAAESRLRTMRADLEGIAKRKAELSKAIDIYTEAIVGLEDIIRRLIS
jgi:hypothetical protein